MEQTKKAKDMHDGINHLIEYRLVLKETRVLLGYQGNQAAIGGGSAVNSINGEHDEEGQEREAPLVAAGSGGVALSNISGTINTDEVLRFRKLIFRATRGNALVYFSDIKSPIIDFYGNEQFKTVYSVLFQDSGTLKDKIARICDSFLGQRFEIP